MVRRSLALAALSLCSLPASALANPSFAVDVAAEGVPGNLPSKVTHRLTMTAAATPETLTLATTGRMTVSGANVTVGEPRAVSATFNCGTKWSRHHGARDLIDEVLPGSDARARRHRGGGDRHGVRRRAVGE